MTLLFHSVFIIDNIVKLTVSFLIPKTKKDLTPYLLSINSLATGLRRDK